MAVWQAKRNIARAQTDIDAIFLLDQFNCFERHQRRIAVVSHRHDQRIDDNVLDRDSHFRSALDDRSRCGKTSLWRGRNALFADGQADDCRAPIPDNRQDRCKLLFLAIDRIDQRLPGRHIQARFQNFWLVGINTERDVHNGKDRFDDFWHDRCFINLRMTDVHIQHVRAPGDLSLGQIFDILEILLDECLSQLFDAGWIDLFPDDHKWFIRPDRRLPSYYFSIWCALFHSCCDVCGIEQKLLWQQIRFLDYTWNDLIPANRHEMNPMNALSVIFLDLADQF